MKDSEIFKLIRSKSKKEKLKTNAWFFKTGKGQYGEGDKFLGITVPESRKLTKELKDITLDQIEMLLESIYHEERLVALLILVHNYELKDKIKDTKSCKEIFKYYLSHTKRINNWDLVDLSAHQIVGKYLLNKNRKILQKLAKSKLLWERRITIISTYRFILNGENKDTFLIADILINDSHDLIQKAVGWMLREAGKRVSEVKLKEYLKTRYMKMPRTMLRYSIEKYSETERSKYLKGIV